MGKRLIIPGADFSANAIEQEPIPVPVEYTLQNGYANIIDTYTLSMDTGASVSTRVRTDQLYGSYKVKTKTGYVIRAIATYDNKLTDFSPGNHTVLGGANVSNVQGLSEYELSADNKYSIITFCKTDATATISPSEDIVDYIIRPSES